MASSILTHNVFIQLDVFRRLRIDYLNFKVEISELFLKLLQKMNKNAKSMIWLTKDQKQDNKVPRILSEIIGI